LPCKREDRLLFLCWVVRLYYAAHDLTKAAIKQVINEIWLEEILSCICNVFVEQYALLSWPMNESLIIF
jgi:hypothetical protein